VGTTPHFTHWQAGSADLARELAELERGRAEGTVSPERLLACIASARAAAGRVDLQPWRDRGLRSGLLAMACLAVWEGVAYGLPDLEERLGPWLDAALALGVLALLRAVWCLVVYVRRRREETAWFDGLEATVRQGGAIVSYLGEPESTASGF